MLLCASHHLERVEGLRNFLFFFGHSFYIIVFVTRFLQMAIFNYLLEWPRGFGLVVKVQHMICCGGACYWWIRCVSLVRTLTQSKAWCLSGEKHSTSTTNNKHGIFPQVSSGWVVSTYTVNVGRLFLVDLRRGKSKTPYYTI